MRNKQIFKPAKKVYLTSLALISITFIAAFYPRIISAVGVPKAINFLHFLIAPFTLVVAIAKTRTKERKQIIISWELITGCLLLLGVILTSALLNRAGVINVFLEFMILGEPFLVLLAIVCIPLPPSRFKKLRAVLLVSCVINLFLALLQKPLIDSGKLSKGNYTPQDAIQGVFYLSGAGNYVSCSISLGVAIYYFLNAKTAPMWQRVFWLLPAFYQVLISDSKQIILTFLVAWGLFTLTKFKNLGKAVIYLVIFVIFVMGLSWCIQNLNIEGFNSMKAWADRAYLYTPDGEGFQTKTSGIRAILSYYKSPLNWLLGLGPGHTIGRLGGWVLRDYESMLLPLGATVHPVSREVWYSLNQLWLAKESTLFMPMFTWAGIWGDLGLLGLGVYLYLGYLVWSRLAQDDFSRFSMMTLLVYGLIITQMEEPGQTMVIAILIGLQWHERQTALRSRYHPAQSASDANTQLEIS
jgi:hypothetical protein